MNSPVKLLKLKNGESIICRVQMDDENVVMMKPVRIHKRMQYTENGTAYETASFGPWESFSSDTLFVIDKNEILCLTEPREDVINYYRMLLSRLEAMSIDRLDDDIEADEEDEDSMWVQEKVTKH